MRFALPTLLLAAGCAGEAAHVDRQAELAAPAPTDVQTGCDYASELVDADFVEGQLSAASLLALAETAWSDPLSWDATGVRTTVHLSLSELADLRRISSAGDACPSALLLDGLVRLSTEDGRLDEAFEATLRYEGHDLARLERWVALDQLAGSWEPRELDPVVHTAADLEIVANLGPGGSSGELALYAQRADGDAEAWDVARWPAAGQ